MSEYKCLDVELVDLDVAITVIPNIHQVGVDSEYHKSYVSINTDLIEHTVVVNQLSPSIDEVFISVEPNIGPPGPQGPPGLSSEGYLYKETPTGSVNGINREFYTSRLVEPMSEMLFINGLLQQEYYTIVGSILTIDDPPEEGDNIFITYKEKIV